MILVVDASTQVVADHGVSWKLRSRATRSRTVQPDGTPETTYHANLHALAFALVQRGLPEPSAQIASRVDELVTDVATKLEPLTAPVVFGGGRFQIRRGEGTIDLLNPAKDVSRLPERTALGKVVVGYFPSLQQALLNAVYRSFMSREETMAYGQLDEALGTHAAELLRDVHTPSNQEAVCRAA